MSTELAMNRRVTSDLMVARACTAKTPGPVMRSRAPAPAPAPAAAGLRLASTAWKAARMACTACCCPAVSEPAARVRTSRSARLRSLEQ